ncbi:uncharacterized [Tachysurus ichikawai]
MAHVLPVIKPTDTSTNERISQNVNTHSLSRRITLFGWGEWKVEQRTNSTDYFDNVILSPSVMSELSADYSLAPDAAHLKYLTNRPSD